MLVVEVIFNSTGFFHPERKDLAQVVNEHPYDAKDIVRSLEEGKKYTVIEGKGWGFSVDKAYPVVAKA